MKIKSALSYLLPFLLLTTSCVQEKVENSTEVKTSGVRAKEEEFSIIGGENRGEFLIGGPAVNITAQVKNTSSYTYKNLSLNINLQSSAAMKFAPNSLGVSNSPGYDGTCKLELAPGQTCTFVMQFTPTNMGELSQELTLSYINLVEPVKKSFKLSFIVGDYSNIIEVNEKIRYDFGTIERMDQDKYYDKTVELQNVGGLTARNLQFSLSNLAEGAYSIAKNNCPTDLPSKAKCEVVVRVRSANYLVTDLSKAYSSDLLLEYFKNPINSPVSERGRYAYNFSAYSAKVEGILAVQGVSGFSFPKLVHGNKAEVDLKLKNTGMKGLIIRKIYVYNSAGVTKAICGRVDSIGGVTCVDMTLTPVTLTSFPFSFKDTNNCLVNAMSDDYERDPITKEFLNSPPKVIDPPTETAMSEVCAFKMTFHSSISNSANTNFDNWVVGFEYDNTFRDTKELVITTGALGAHFTAIAAQGYLGSALKVSNYRFNTTNYPNPVSPYIFDVGRIALLQPTSTYSDVIKISLQNTNTASPVKIKSVAAETDVSGVNVLFSNSGKVINDYFTGAYLSTNCKINVAYKTNICDLQFNFSPKSPNSPTKLIGPVALAAGKSERAFLVTYNNGCTINDDGTPCADNTLLVSYKATLTERGNLQYNTLLSGASGSLPKNYNVGTTLVAGKPLVGSRIWYNLWLDNIGTGTIPYLKTVTSFSFKTTSTSLPSPFAIIADSTGLAVGEEDCRNYLRATPDLNTTLPTALTTPIAFAPATRCRLRVESMIYPNERITNYGSTEWRREFYTDRANNREYLYQVSNDKYLMFEFYDNDITTPTPSANFVNNFGEKTTILGGSTGKFLFKSAFAYYGKVIPVRPTPVIGSLLYRPSFTLPAVAKDPNSQMAALGAQTIASHVYTSESFAGVYNSYATSGNNISVPLAAGVTALPAVGTRENYSYFNNLYSFANYIGYDYVFHAGSFPAQTGQEHFASFSLENTGYGVVNNLVTALVCDVSPQGCGLPANTIARGPELILSSLAALSGNTLVSFKINPTSALDVGLHEATFTLNFKNPEDKTLRIKVLFNIVPNNEKQISITSTDYECPDEACAAPISTGPDVDITNQFLYNRLPNSNTKMVSVAGSPIRARKKIVIRNNGTTPITNLKIFFKDTAASPLAKYINVLGFKILPSSTTAAPYQCQSAGQTGILLTNDTCVVNIYYAPISASNLPQVLGIGYRLVDGTGSAGSYINQFLDILFVGDNQSNLVIDTTTPKSYSYMAQAVSSYPVRFSKFIESNHPLLTTFPKTTFDSVPLITTPPVELFNQRSEKASLLKQYEDYALANALPAIPPVQAWTRIYLSANTEIAVEANQGCFYGNDYLNAAIPDDRKGFYSNDQGLSTGCRLRVLYTVGIEKRGTINSANTIIPIKYYSSRRLTTKTVYLHLEGFVEPFRSTNDGTEINNVITSDNGTVQFSWNSFLDETAPHGNLDRYRVYYSKFGSDLVKFFDATIPNTLMFADTVSNDASIEISGLEPGRYYFFQIVAMRRTNPLDQNTEYISMPDSLYRKKILIPPAGFGFDYATSHLIERSLYPLSGDTVSRTEAQTACSAKKVDLKDEGVTLNKALELINSEIYDDIIMSERDILINNQGNPANLAFSDHNFLEASTWMNDIADISGVFNPGYDCTQAVGFNLDNTASYIKSCDNNNPLTLCCNANILSQVRGLPMPSSPTIETLYTNLSGIKAQYRCFLKLTP